MPYEIPAIVQDRVSPRAREYLKKIEHFVETECIPADEVYEAQVSKEPSLRWKSYPPIIDELKKKARAQGLWNLFLSKTHYSQGAGFTNLEYGLMAEILGRSHTGSEAMNCSAPDTGNMEVLAKYGNDAQKKEWLEPLLDGKIRSAFLMTERYAASSDAKNIDMKMRIEGDTIVLNGTKWWSSGACDPRCAVYITMTKTENNISTDAFKQQSVVIVPANTPGITVLRPLHVYGYDDAPHGHAEVRFVNVRIPKSNLVLGEGRGFEIIQGRLGPGRIHHCMRSIGAAERGLDYMIARVNDPSRRTFGKLISEHGTIRTWIAESRIQIDSCRLLVLNAADKIDRNDAKAALKEIAMAKIVVPRTVIDVLDKAIQAHGAGGICQDFPLARMWAGIRTLRIADGPDEVHLAQMGRNENKRAAEIVKRHEAQEKRREELFRLYKIEGRSQL
ncbi:hypothetical protein TWF569_009333 [Orbilia oligospora]|uniref:Acyl-CoA dehydrogenase NM domain-like protein n=1 Tax=Orbilia oligospora TaxID=2813651 RepID=A0A7C8J4P4_ORBOL|nr:hypothetical protein TWF102_011580 [Orbilia oligospora]KAF3094616.1 hypothetical protein TWF706_008453 [Orbilia oligospora]KAF3096482.1 hypothetical protein TWF103_009816 [Orbilia oligospora]KAF3133199.1 hypothetical protein TWF703_007041 [Orbilia oligospora]KAF3136059.1 hypothetical protein TWF594_008032 [Orbilia oligospora]